jgi:hypothetical protein
MSGNFLSDVFCNELAGLLILIWIKRGPESAPGYFCDIAAASAFASKASFDGWDVYVGCGLRNNDHGPYRRGGSEAVGGVGGFWLDIDVAGPAHTKKNYPPDREAALSCLDELPLRPTLIVDSGHGFQAWWLFRELWTFESPEEREHAQRLSHGLQLLVASVAATHGWMVDMTWDLARVLRLPGTINYKAPSAPVTIWHDRGPRWNPSDFQDFSLPATLGDHQRRADDGHDQLLLGLGRQPPGDKLSKLFSDEPRFAGAFTRQRTDLASDSEADLAIANHAARAGWTDQEIADAITASRKLYGRATNSDEKARRIDYLQRTIARARTRSSPSGVIITKSGGLRIIKSTVPSTVLLRQLTNHAK